MAEPESSGHKRPRLSPPMADARRAVKTLLERHSADIPARSHFLVALSGGADSLALTWAAQFVLPTLGYSLEAIVIDHGVHEDSADIAATAAARCQQLGVPAQVRRVSLGTEGGMEHQARLARYGALRSAREETRAHGVLLGHTLDDQAETVLLGLARGSGPGSLRAMAAHSEVWWRPFLTLRRETTRQVCLDAGITWWDDPHNTDLTFARPRVRHSVLPLLERELGPGVAAALARTAELLRADDDALDQIASELVAAQQDLISRGEIALPALEGVPEAVLSRVLRHAVREVAGSTLSAQHTDELVALVNEWHGQGPIDLPAASVVRHGGTLKIVAHPRGKGK